jgi:transcription antitermination factor NusG
MRGLTGLVTFDGVAPLVPDDVIANLRQRIAEMNEGDGLLSRFKPGDKVWVRWRSGETEDLAEVVSDTRSAQGRVRVLIEFLGRLVHGEIPRSSIRPIDDSEASGSEDRSFSRRRTRGKGRWIQGSGPHAAIR